MRRIFAVWAFGVGSLVGSSALADQIPGSQTRVANWTIGAYEQDGRFSHCTMATPYASGITMLLSVSGNYTWRIGWTHPAWQFSQGQSVDIVEYVDGIGPFYLKATAVSKNLAITELPANAAVFDVMRKGYVMTVQAVGNAYEFNLDGTDAALTETVACVRHYVASAPPIVQRAGPTTPSLAVPEPTIEAVTAEQRLEARKVVANILAQGQMTGFRLLSSEEVSDLKSEYLSKSDVVWKADDVLGTLTIIPRTIGVSATDIASALVADDVRNCKGQSASGTTKDERNADVVRMFTACKDDKGGWEGHYTVVPLGDGSYYLFATGSLVRTGESGTNAAKADALLRDAVFEVMRK
jgi:hypothetical protein